MIIGFKANKNITSLMHDFVSVRTNPQQSPGAADGALGQLGVSSFSSVMENERVHASDGNTDKCHLTFQD